MHKGRLVEFLDASVGQLSYAHRDGIRTSTRSTRKTHICRMHPHATTWSVIQTYFVVIASSTPGTPTNLAYMHALEFGWRINITQRGLCTYNSRRKTFKQHVTILSSRYQMLCRICTAHMQYTKRVLDGLGCLTHPQKYEIQNKIEETISSGKSRSSRRNRLSVRRAI